MSTPPGLEVPPPYEQWLVAVMPQFEEKFGMARAVEAAEAYYQKKYLSPIEAYNMGFAAAQAQAAATNALLQPVPAFQVEAAAFPPSPPAEVMPAVALDPQLMASLQRVPTAPWTRGTQRPAEPSRLPPLAAGGARLPEAGGAWLPSGGGAALPDAGHVAAESAPAEASWYDTSAVADDAWRDDADKGWQGAWYEGWQSSSSWEAAEDKQDAGRNERRRHRSRDDSWEERKRHKVVHHDDPEYVKHCSAKAVDWYTARNRTGWLNKITPLIYHMLKGKDKDWEIAVNIAKDYSDDKQVENLIHLYGRHLKD